jgi:hypothetical protein
MLSEILQLSPRVAVLPIIHGSGDFALEVRRVMLAHRYDCLAVPLPPSFQQEVETAIEWLPTPSLVLQREAPRFPASWSPHDWSPEENEEEDGDNELDEDDEPGVSYVPIDPCQGVIAGLRTALGEHIARAFIDLETARFEPHSAVMPDPYALKQVAVERFAAAILPSLPRPIGQPLARVTHMARRLRELEQRYQSILFVCSVLDWPWVREAYREESLPTAEDDDVEPTEHYRVDPKTLMFLLGELPFITGLYERARAELEDDENLSLDGVKELLVSAREAYKAELKSRARKITPHRLKLCLKYIRNLSLIERRLTPDLYTIVIAAKQLAGDQFALHVAETARTYPYLKDTPFPKAAMGVGRVRTPEGEIFNAVSRLPGVPVTWRSLDLQRRPEKPEIEKWRMQWNPYSQCSWPPEDELIENFRSHVFDRAKQIMGNDLARTQKFTTSVEDGIDFRETLRHWYDGDIYVKVLPPARGNLDCAVMLFDAPADPREYPWRTTWFAEHQEESTLAFFATDFRREPIGPGICLASYGGAMFLFPPVSIPDVWLDPELDFAETLEERLLAAACRHSQCRHIALVSSAPPGAGWRRLAKRYGKKWVHVPLGQFSESTVQQLRMVHVLNGKTVRSYAAHFIRKA